MGKEFTGKVVLVGATNAGKTSIVERFVHGQIHPCQPSTQPCFFKKKVILKNSSVNLEIWDTAGQERYHSLSPLFYREADVGIVVYDCTEQQSFDRANDWAQELRSELGNNIEIVLVGNKIDLNSEDKIKLSEAIEISKEWKAKVIETSAFTGDNIDLLFTTVAGIIEEKCIYQSTANKDHEADHKTRPCMC